MATNPAISYTRREPPQPITCKCGCNGTLDRFDRHNRERRYIRGHQFKIIEKREAKEFVAS